MGGVLDGEKGAVADARVRAVAASLAAQPVPFPNSTRLPPKGPSRA